MRTLRTRISCRFKLGNRQKRPVFSHAAEKSSPIAHPFSLTRLLRPSLEGAVPPYISSYRGVSDDLYNYENWVRLFPFLLRAGPGSYRILIEGGRISLGAHRNRWLGPKGQSTRKSENVFVLEAIQLGAGLAKPELFLSSLIL